MNLTKDDILTFFSNEYGKEGVIRHARLWKNAIVYWQRRAEGIRYVMSWVSPMGCRAKLR
mgnify:CR=1 FL=1